MVTLNGVKQVLYGLIFVGLFICLIIYGHMGYNWWMNKYMKEWSDNYQLHGFIPRGTWHRERLQTNQGRTYKPQPLIPSRRASRQAIIDKILDIIDSERGGYDNNNGPMRFYGEDNAYNGYAMRKRDNNVMTGNDVRREESRPVSQLQNLNGDFFRDGDDSAPVGGSIRVPSYRRRLQPKTWNMLQPNEME